MKICSVVVKTPKHGRKSKSIFLYGLEFAEFEK